MKTKLLTLVLLILINSTSFSQDAQSSPTLNLTGSSPSLSKGNINTEVLTAIIQKKQEEIKQRVFKNTIISQFNNSENNYKRRLNNFATYNYLYSLMDILTSGKNKKVMTKSAIEKSAEFVFIFGLAMYTNPEIIEEAKITSLEKDKSGSPIYNKYKINELNVHKFNVIIDMVYSIIIEPENEAVIQEFFKFDQSLSNLNFKIWNEKDNTYSKEKITTWAKYLSKKHTNYLPNKNISDFTKKELETIIKKINELSIEQKTSLVKEWTENTQIIKEQETEIFSIEKTENLTQKIILSIQKKSIFSVDDLTHLKKQTVNKVKDLFKNLKSLQQFINENQSIDNDELELKILNKFPDIDQKAIEKISKDFKIKINELIKELENLSASEISDKINKLKDKFDYLLNENQKELIVKLTTFINQDYDEYRQIFNFFTGLHKVNYKDFSLTQKQYDALKYILLKFIGIAKNQHPNDVVASVLDFLIENTIIEYNTNGNIVDSESEESIGYLYVDVESLIYTIDQNFSSVTKKGITKYITPFFSIGTNYASFNQSNSLISNADGTQSSLGNLYFASEKIGLKWKLWNWKYTHAFKAGESFNYYGKTTHWFRPQEEPLISDIHFVAYGSGLLYNLVDLKSENDFNYAIVGAGLGITFFNGLSANISIASPIIDKKLENSFINFGFDIPIIEYISALSKKK